MRQSSTGAGPTHPHRLDHHLPVVSVQSLVQLQSDSVDTLTTTASGSQHTVSAAEVEEHETYLSDGGEYETRETIKLTSRSTPPFRRDAYTSTRRPRVRSRSRDETSEKIQDEDEATLRELLIRWRKDDDDDVEVLRRARRVRDDDDDDHDVGDETSDRLRFSLLTGYWIIKRRAKGYLGRCPL